MRFIFAAYSVYFFQLVFLTVDAVASDGGPGGQQQGTCLNNNNNCGEEGTADNAAAARRYILRNGEPVDLGLFPSHLDENTGINITVIDEKRKLYYVRSFASKEETLKIVDSCTGDGGRFGRSPLTDPAANTEVRTSSSCPLLFAYFYMPRIDELREKRPDLVEQLELTWELTQRAAALLKVNEANLEPFQVLRYLPGEFYKQHHDHRGHYDPVNGYPDRPTTMLLFLNDVESGGHTKFDELGLEFVPRCGDAVIWSNIDENGKSDPSMVHQGLPPESGVKMAINIWVRDKPFTSPQQASQRQH